MPTKPPGTPDVDLTTAGSFGTIDDAVFQTALAQPAGTGVFNAFVQIQHNGIEQGYNTDNSTEQFDEKNAHHHSLLLANVPIVMGDGTNGTVDGVAYREFLLDLNEPAVTPTIWPTISMPAPTAGSASMTACRMAAGRATWRS